MSAAVMPMVRLPASDADSLAQRNVQGFVRLGTNEPTNEPLTNPEKWIGSDQLAALAGVSERMIQKALKNGKYHGAVLDVRTIESNVGRGGIVRQVHVASLPPELRDRYYLQFGIDIHAQTIAGQSQSLRTIYDAIGYDAQEEKVLLKAQWRFSIIRPILATPERSKERAAMIAQIVDAGVIGIDQERESISNGSLYGWLKAYAKSGIDGLKTDKRKDAGKKRVIVSRSYDDFFKGHVSHDVLASVADNMEHHIRGLWAAGAAGWRAVSEQATTRLIEYSEALDVAAFNVLPKGKPSDSSKARTQFGICNVSRRRAEDERRYQLIATKDKDNATYQDKYAASITRDYSDLMPREMIVGDVHPVDVMMRRPDGSTVYPKAISWMDPATNEIHMTFVLCEKGEGIKREHVAQSFEAMTEDWGLPKLLYLDNGSEYKWAEMIDGFTMLSKLANIPVKGLDTDNQVANRVDAARESVIRSLAYNAKGKPKIEGAFGNIEQVFFSTIKGWTAGDRMNKKTHQKGRDPMAFDGGAEQFLETASKALQWYHRRPQHGRLNGRSPNEALGDFIKDGWGKTALADPRVLALAFATAETRIADRGGVQYKPRAKGAKTIRFYHDDLLPLTGQKITIKVPAYNPEYVFCFDGPDLVCIASPEQTYSPLNAEGAREGSRRNTYLRRHIAERRQHCALLSLTDEVERHIQHLPDTPEAPVAKTVRVDVLERMAALEHKTREELSENSEKPKRELSQWAARDEDNPHIQAVKFLEEDDD